MVSQKLLVGNIETFVAISTYACLRKQKSDSTNFVEDAYTNFIFRLFECVKITATRKLC